MSLVVVLMTKNKIVGYKALIFQIDRSTPLCNPTSLKPFADNPEKLRRYEQFERAVRQRMRGELVMYQYITCKLYVDTKLMQQSLKFARDKNKNCQKFLILVLCLFIIFLDPYSTIDSNLTEWERKHERDEFTRISRVYLHLTTNINSRFTKASAEEDENKIKEVEIEVVEVYFQSFVSSTVYQIIIYFFKL